MFVAIFNVITSTNNGYQKSSAATHQLKSDVVGIVENRPNYVSLAIRADYRKFLEDLYPQISTTTFLCFPCYLRFSPLFSSPRIVKNANTKSANTEARLKI